MVEPKCPYFGTCGGCTLQTTEYQYQLKDKKRQLADAIQFNDFSSDISVHSDVEYFYRNRMDFIFHERGIGLREKGHWNKIVDIQECVIADKKINTLLTEIRNHFSKCDYFDIKKHTGTFRYAVIRVSDDASSISFVLNEDSTRLAEAQERIRAFAESSSATNIIVTYVPAQTDVSISSEFFVVKGEDTIETTYLGKKFVYSVQGFYQNNHIMAEKMHAYVQSLIAAQGIEQTKKMHLLDLYGGVGAFGIMNADSFKSMLTVESVKECTEAAVKNMALNGVTNGSAKTLDAKNIRKLSLQQPLFVITDPPRSGMDEMTIQHLNLVKPKTIIYISCNVEQLKRDIPKFKNYEVKSAALFDLFPQTPHSEAVVELALKQ